MRFSRRTGGTGAGWHGRGLGRPHWCGLGVIVLLTACEAKRPASEPATGAPAGTVAGATVPSRPLGLPTGTFVDRDQEAELRVVTYNVNWNSLFEDVNAKRAARFARLVVALNPDVLALQEVGMSPQDRGKTGSRKRTAADVLKVMNAVAPLPAGTPQLRSGQAEAGRNAAGGGWYAFQGGDNVIVSKYPLQMTAHRTLPEGERELAIALVDLPDEQFRFDLYVLSNHFKCCGGTDNDPQRQQQADAVVSWLRDARTPGGQVDLPAATPIIVLGDLNLVGGPQPLATLVDGDISNEAVYGADSTPDWDGTALTDAHPRHNVAGSDDYTWRDDTQQYKPGRLDYIIYSDSVLEVVKSFVLNTTTMSEEELRATGLEKNDTVMDDVGEKYDHLPVVADFRGAARAK